MGYVPSSVNYPTFCPQFGGQQRGEFPRPPGSTHSIHFESTLQNRFQCSLYPPRVWALVNHPTLFQRCSDTIEASMGQVRNILRPLIRWLVLNLHTTELQ